MPLIVMCGRPCTGKTTRAKEIKEYMEKEHKMEVILINEESLGLLRDQCYANVVSEKEMRGTLRSQVEKNVTSKNLVILDSCNFIKGLRYELYCLARTAKSTNCVVYCESPLAVSQKWNEGRQGDKYSEELFTDLSKRVHIFKPDRWDAPLFFIPFEQQTPLKDIAQAVIFDEKKSKDPVSTKPDLIKSGNFVQDLDKILQGILDTIITRQNEIMLLNGGLDRIFLTVKFDGIDKELQLKRSVPVGQLKQFKTDFITMNKHSPLQNLEKAGKAFIDYIQSYENDY